MSVHELHDPGAVDRVDLPRARLRCQHREDPGAGPDVEHDVARSDHLGDRRRVGVDPHAIEQHVRVRRGIQVAPHRGHRARG
jgi:hypothetical protein